MEDHIPKGPDRSLLLGRHTSKWSLWDVVFHEIIIIHQLQGVSEKQRKPHLKEIFLGHLVY